MPRFVHLTVSDARQIPWKNGRGVTEELVISPASATVAADDFDWRVSRASVPESGPFSSFPGLDRVLVVLEGDGLQLTHCALGETSRSVRLLPLVPHAFSGNWETSAQLVSGGVRDFNVMTRRGRASAEVAVVSLGALAERTTLNSSEGLIYAVRGEVRIDTRGATHRLDESEGLRVIDTAVDADAPCHVDLFGTPGAVAIVVQFTLSA